MSEKLDDTDCIVYDSDMAVEIDRGNNYFFPDAMVTCGERKFSDERQRFLKNPVLIVEVLSKSTENYDRSEKFRFYRGILSLKEYVLISSDRPVVESFYREGEGLWRISTASKLESNIHLYSLNIDIPLAQIYAKVTDLKDPFDGLPFIQKPA